MFTPGGVAGQSTDLNFESDWTLSPLYQETVPNSSGIWLLPNVAPGVDATLTLVGFYGTGGQIQTTTIPTVGTFRNVYSEDLVPNRWQNGLAIDFRGVSTTFAGAEFTLSFSQPVTTTFGILDLDTATGGVVEEVGIQSSAIGSVSLGSEVTDGGISGGYQWFGGSTNTASYSNVSIQDELLQPDVTAEFDVTNLSSLNFRWQFSRSTSGTNSRTFYLATVPEPSVGFLSFLAVGLALQVRRRSRA